MHDDFDIDLHTKKVGQLLLWECETLHSSIIPSEKYQEHTQHHHDGVGGPPASSCAGRPKMRRGAETQTMSPQLSLHLHHVIITSRDFAIERERHPARNHGHHDCN